MDKLIIIQARVGSSRLPRKVLKRIGSKKMLQHVIDRCKQTGIETILVSPESRENDVLENFGVPCFREGETDVLAMYYHAALKYKAERICRVTGDCPLVDPALVVATLETTEAADYVTCEGFPRGVWCEAMNIEALSCTYLCATKEYQRVHVTPYLYEGNPWCINKKLTMQPASPYRVCVDEYADLVTVRNIVREIGERCNTREIIDLLDAQPEWIANGQVGQKDYHVSV